MKVIRILAAARRDIEVERHYYNRALAGLGEKFARAVWLVVYVNLVRIQKLCKK